MATRALRHVGAARRIEVRAARQVCSRFADRGRDFTEVGIAPTDVGAIPAGCAPPRRLWERRIGPYASFSAGNAEKRTGQLTGAELANSLVETSDASSISAHVRWHKWNCV